MFDSARLIVGTANAADAVPATAGADFGLMRFLPLFLIFGVFYFLLIRPQQKRVDEQSAMIKALKKGDRVVTSGGIVGTIASLEGDDHVMVTIADGVQIKVVRSTIVSLAGDVPDGKAGKPARKK
jgi:preprotein translocase subunit YajC